MSTPGTPGSRRAPAGFRDGRPLGARRVRRGPSAAATDHVRRRMQDQQMRDTGPELALRRRLHAIGLRYRVDRAPLAGLRRRADVVFGPAKVAVFVDGCFWHGCPEHGVQPRTNSRWWRAKLEANRARDLDTNTRLASAGWLVLRFWEHEDPTASADVVRAAVLARRALAIRRRGRSVEGEGEVLHAVVEGGRDEDGGCGRPQSREAGVELAEEEVELAAGELGAEAEVRAAAAEAEVRVR
jgi:DNA mismatch endonuclease, patch repair protein